MQIVNYIKDSTIECAPFNWGLTLFSFGCNLHCKMCEGYNYERITNEENILDNAINIIKNNITPLHDCVVFIGGEPTIWDDKLIEALEYCNSNNLKTKIFTNGMLPDIVKKINDKKLCDAWSVDFKGLYNIKEQFGIDDNLYKENIKKTLYNITQNNLPLELRTTFFDGNITDKKEICKLGKDFIKTYSKYVDYAKYIEQKDVRKILKK